MFLNLTPDVVKRSEHELMESVNDDSRKSYGCTALLSFRSDHVSFCRGNNNFNPPRFAVGKLLVRWYDGGIHGNSRSSFPECSKRRARIRKTDIRNTVESTNVFVLRVKEKMSFSEPKYWSTIPNGVVSNNNCTQSAFLHFVMGKSIKLLLRH